MAAKKYANSHEMHVSEIHNLSGFVRSESPQATIVFPKQALDAQPRSRKYAWLAGLWIKT
jgi:hypothetical protein|tara:strand:+ start:1144 stop:1323 length:180 start_codon:yes stop_codon:yes gene_type:complete